MKVLTGLESVLAALQPDCGVCDTMLPEDVSSTSLNGRIFLAAGRKFGAG